MNDPTERGLSVNVDQPAVEDVFDYAYKHWRQAKSQLICGSGHLEDKLASDSAAVLEFLTIARHLFSENQPVSHDFLGDSLSLRFQDGRSLAFCRPPDGQTMGMQGGDVGAVQVGKYHPPRGNDGRGWTAEAPSWGVTGQ